MSDPIEEMLAARAGGAQNQKDVYSGERVVVSGLPAEQGAPEVDPLEQMLQSRASATVQDQGSPKQEIDPHKGEYGTIGNLGYGALKGLADMVHAPAQLALHGIDYVNQKLPGGGSTAITNVKNKFDTHLKNQEELYQLDTTGSISAGVGRVAANIVPFLASGGTSAAAQGGSKALQLASLLGKGGAAAMATQPINNVNNDFAEQKAMQGAFGVGGAAVGGALGGIANKVFNPKFSPEVIAARAEGITPTIGQMSGGMFAGLENKLTSAPLLGHIIKNAQKSTTIDFNRAAYNRALAPIGESAGKEFPVGHEGISMVKNSLSNAYNNLLPKLQFKGDQKVSDELVNLTTMINNGNIPESSAKQFNSILKNNVLSRMTNGSMDGIQFKALESDLGGIIKNKARTDPELASALKEVMTTLRSGLERSNPNEAGKLAKINEGYANYARIRSASSGVGTDNGIFTPAQLANAVKSLDRSAGKGDSATGNALMQDLVKIGKNVAPTYSDSGTAGRMAALGLGVGAVAAPTVGAAGLAAGSVAALPYTQIGKKIMASILMDRPAFARSLGSSAGNHLPLVGAPALSLGAQQLNNGN